MSVGVIIHEIAEANEAERAFLRSAGNLLREAVSMPGFGASVRQSEYGSTKWRSRHGSVKELDGEEIWDRIHLGRESGHTGDHTLNLKIEIVDLPGPDDGKAIIGATELGNLPIRVARWFVEHCMLAGDRVNMAAHLMHQWMHVSGFVHPEDGHAPTDAPVVIARLVRRALERDYGDEIDAKATMMLLGTHTGDDCALPAEDPSVG